MANSVEEKVEEYFKQELDSYKITHYGKTDPVNSSIKKALDTANSKSGGLGNNYPDIKLLLSNDYQRHIPVMIEAKGSKGKLEKRTKQGDIELTSTGKNPYSAVQNYAVNGALHYGLAILEEHTYNEVIIIGINGTELDNERKLKDPELKAYYVSEKNNRIPKEIVGFEFIQMKKDNLDKFYACLDALNLTEEEMEELTRQTEVTLEEKIKSIHQNIYENVQIKTALSTNDKLYLFCGLIMAGLKTPGVKPLEESHLPGNDNERSHDGIVLLNRIETFLYAKKCSNEKVDMIKNLLQGVFLNKTLWKPNHGTSILRTLFQQVKDDIIPCLESNLHLDFTGKIFSSLSDWCSISEDVKNDVVLTPRMVTTLMVRLCRINKDSVLWDNTMGTGGFLTSGLTEMIKDAETKIKDKALLDAKIQEIKTRQIFGIEILGQIYMLSCLNLLLAGDGSSNIIHGDAHEELTHLHIRPNCYCLNPPYSHTSKGLIFFEEGLDYMKDNGGYAAVLVQENAGSGQGQPSAKRILQNNTLLASIKMADIFKGKASVQTAIYVFKVGVPHDADQMVTFIDFSEDGYLRQNRKKSTQEVNLRDDGTAKARYAEIEAIVLGKKPKTNFYTEENGKVVKDTITLSGNDWTFQQHRQVDSMPQDADFRKTVADFLSFKVSQILKGQVNADV